MAQYTAYIQRCFYYKLSSQKTGYSKIFTQIEDYYFLCL